MIIVKILAIIALSVAIMFLSKKIIEGVLNVKALNEKNFHDVTRQKHGIVYNKKTQKLEADQSLILPF